ncbi:MAG: enoyl-CoA hydratase [Caulobacterales bacterium]
MLLIDKSDKVAVVTLNRPEAMNALSVALRAAIARAFIDLAADPEVSVIVLTGAGRAFTAGLDLKELGSQPRAARADAGGDPVAAMRACGKPIIGAINGVAITGGFEIALACDVLLASTEARFADTHARVGILPGWGLSQILSRVIGPYRAKELSLTGNFLDARTAYEWGLVNRVFAPDELMPAALKLAADMASILPATLYMYKSIIDAGFDLPFGEAMRFELEQTGPNNRAVTPEMVEARRPGIQARGRDWVKGG